jgi:hypothetical protein
MGVKMYNLLLVTQILYTGIFRSSIAKNLYTSTFRGFIINRKNLHFKFIQKIRNLNAKFKKIHIGFIKFKTLKQSLR